MKRITIALLIFSASLAWGMRVSKFTIPPGIISVTNADVYTKGISFQQDANYAVQSVWTGASIAGTVQLEATIDGINWEPITGTAEVVSGPGSFIWNVPNASYDQFRVHFVYSSGSGTIVAFAETKGP